MPLVRARTAAGLFLTTASGPTGLARKRDCPVLDASTELTIRSILILVQPGFNPSM
jgi:hypothetical protein